MKNSSIHLQLLSLGVFLLMSFSAHAAKNECYSAAEFKDFKTLYLKLQNELNYEGQDAYLDKNMQVQLKPHAKNTPYPGKEFETALFSEYQNSLRKVGKLYQDAKYEDNEDFKSNEILVNFMKAIDDKNSSTEEYINKTKIADVINALEEVSKRKFTNSADKKFVINSGDKFLLEKLLTHAQDRVCSVKKYDQTQKDQKYFKADYLLKVKNAPLNLLVSAIQNSSIEKDSIIDLKPSSKLTADLVDTNIAIKSAITENLNDLSAWVKKVKARGAHCLAAINTKSFANKIQNQIQGCNFGLFMETLGADNADNLESILHFINANEKLLDFAAAKAETNLDEMKLEGYISKTFESLGSEIKCTIVDSANNEDKKIFIRNLPYDEKLNTFDTSSILCKTNTKPLSTDTCKKQFDLISDSLGRGIELKPKSNIDQSLVYSIKNAKTCSNIAVKDLKSTSKKSNVSDLPDPKKDTTSTIKDNVVTIPQDTTKVSKEEASSNSSDKKPTLTQSNDDKTNTNTNTKTKTNTNTNTEKEVTTPSGTKQSSNTTSESRTPPITVVDISTTTDNGSSKDSKVVTDSDTQGPSAEQIACEKNKKEAAAFVWIYA